MPTQSNNAVFPHLLAPMRLGRREIKNRIVSTAHGENMCEEGLITPHLIDYHVQRAKGGAGLLITFGSASISPDAANHGLVNLWRESNVPMLSDLADQVHAYGAVLMAQASHRGYRERAGYFHSYTQAPSARPGTPPQGSPHVLREDEIAEIVEYYADAADRLVRSGFDGIEITAQGTHLIEQFWSPRVNHRDDLYGGSFDNRMRFGREVLQAVTSRVPEDFLIGLRISCDPLTDLLDLTAADLLTIAQDLAQVGRIDLFNLVGGSGANIDTLAGGVPNDEYPMGTYVGAAKRFKDALRAPVLVAGRILEPHQAEQVLAAQEADLVGMTRALIADPAMPERIRQLSEGAPRPCIAINEGCRPRSATAAISCTVNPAVADRSMARLIPAAQRKKVAVIGAGPAGMEAARVAALRGHTVEVFERDSRVGGQINVAVLDTHRPNLGRHIDWLTGELDRLKVTVHTAVTVSADELVASSVPDAIVVATGARQTIPAAFNGVLNCPVVTDADVLTGRAAVEPGARVLVYDFESYVRGPSIANILVEKDASVRLATPNGSVVEFLEPQSCPPMMKRLSCNGIEFLVDEDIVDVRAGVLRLRHRYSNTEWDLGDCDLIVAVGQRESNTELSDRLRDVAPATELYVIGDAKAPRLLRHAISEGLRTGIKL